MKPEDLYWGLLNRDDLRQISGLTFEQVRFVVSLIAPADFETWLAWHEGLEKWEPIKKFPNLLDPSQRIFTISPPSPPSAQEGAESVDEIPVKVDRRLNRRFLKQFQVEIKGPSGEIFRTRTVNLSSNGMLIESSLPLEFGRNFACKISRADGASMDVFAALVRNTETESDDRRRIKFLEVALPKVLLAWLIDPKTT